MSFYQKRAHLCAVARGREMFAEVEGMTPARFDILYCIFRRRKAKEAAIVGYFLEQARITEALGLARQTVWKGIERLIELGFLTKSKDQTPRSRRNILRITDAGVRWVRAAANAAFSDRAPLPRDAPATGTWMGTIPRYWRRPELADPLPPGVTPPKRKWTLAERLAFRLKGEPLPRSTVGREVERIYTSLAWNRIGRSGQTGRRGKREQHLLKLDDMVGHARDVALALGNRVDSIYTIRFFEELDH